jgi:hypothetical protein
MLASTEARNQDDAGAAIYDLSIGSTAYQLFHEYDSEPVRAHAIATTADDNQLTEADLLQVLTQSWRYCLGFNELTSDQIVPLESQLTNFPPFPKRKRLHGAWHNFQDKLEDLQTHAVRVLRDFSNSSIDPASYFVDRFARDSCFPLECGGSQCQPQ